MTITEKSIIAKMLFNAGVFPGDPPMPLIYSFTVRTNGQENYAFFSHPDFDDIQESVKSGWISNPVCLMSNCILTEAGRKWMKDNGYNLPAEFRRERNSVLTREDIYDAVAKAMTVKDPHGEGLRTNKATRIAEKTCEILGLMEDVCPYCRNVPWSETHENGCPNEDTYERPDAAQVVSAYLHAILVVAYEEDSIVLEMEETTLVNELELT